MKPNPQCYGVIGELKPVKPSSDGVGKMVSVLVSVADSTTPKQLLHAQLGMEPVVGFEPTTDGLQNRCSTTELNWQTRTTLILEEPKFQASQFDIPLKSMSWKWPNSGWQIS
jgi:hypothetical protein